MTDHPPRIAIVGTGALGGFYGAMLANAGNDVHFLLRSDYEAVRDKGLQVKLEWSGKEIRIQPAQAYRSPEDLGPVDLVIIALKTTANSHLPDLLKPLIAPETALLTLQNGLGNVERLEAHFPGNPIAAGLCFIALNRVQPGVIRNLFEGRLTLGAHCGINPTTLEALVQRFSATGIKTRPAPLLQEALWRKLIWNVPFNGLSISLGDKTTDQIMGDPEHAALARHLMNDIQRAAASQSIEIPDDFLEKQIATTIAMPPYAPSSLIDFRAGRPIEVESIFGEPLRAAQQANVQVPYLESLYTTLKALTP